MAESLDPAKAQFKKELMKLMEEGEYDISGPQYIPEDEADKYLVHNQEPAYVD